MEQIRKTGDCYYYGEVCCDTIEQVYELFRTDFNEKAGRDSFGRLDHLGRRKERIHGFGFDFAEKVGTETFRRCGKVRYRLLGLVGISYCRMLGRDDCPILPDEQFEQWFDYAFSRGSGVLRLVGRKKNTGRTSKNLKKRYR